MDSLSELLHEAKAQGHTLGQMAVLYEAESSFCTPETAIKQMMIHLDTMEAAIDKGLDTPLPSVSGQSGGDAQRLSRQNPRLLGTMAHQAMVYALATMEVNASMGRIVAAPTAGSCGIVPGVLFAVARSGDYTREQMVQALFAAAAVGQVIGQNATLSGAQGGCQAECGSAAAMAAAAVVELVGGSPDAALEASAMALKNTLGLACDPVAGLVEIPCIKRNALCALLSLGAAEMALAGITSAIPVDEVIGAMDSVGRSLPAELKETAGGGLAQTPRGRHIARSLYGEPKE